MDESAKPARRRVFSRIAVVRLVLFFLIVGFAYGGSEIGLGFAAKYVPAAFKSAVLVGLAVAFALLLIAVYAGLVRWLERRTVKELSPLPGLPRLIAGLLVAFLMFCAAYGIFWALGCAQWHGVAGTGHVATFAAIAVISGVGEELIFRGGVYRVLEDSLGSGLALILSGALFGGMHLFNPHATLFGAAAIALEAGVLLGLAYTATRNLWLPIGIHAGWNFTEGGVFGAAVSGFHNRQGIFDMPLSGPDWLTGGAFGPEASVVTLGVCTAIALYYLVVTVRRGRWVKLSFHMMLD